MSVGIARILRKQARVSEINLKRALSSKEATGKLRNSIGFNVSTNSGVVRMLGISNVRGFPYWQVIDQGAKGPFKGIMPETPDFRKWLAARGIDKRASFPIRRAISRRGLKPTFIFSNENEKTFREVSDALPPQWMAEVRNKFQQFKNI